MAYNFTFFLTLCLTLFTVPASSAPISMTLAQQLAENFLIHVHAAHTISSMESVQSGGEQVGYVVNLSPQGYILIAGDDIRVPVKGYSLSSSFADLPVTYTENLLRELEVSTTSLGKTSAGTSSIAIDDTNAPFWEYLLQAGKQPATPATQANYTPDTYLLTSRWDQGFPYNKLNPMINGSPTLTGCTQTAIAQVMRYHAHPGSGTGVFTHNWNGQSLTAVMNRPFNWSIMPDKLDGSIPGHQQEEVAALMRDLGILNQANFGLSGTSAAFYQSSFARAFGYAPVANLHIGSDTGPFFAAIKTEIDNSRPVLLSMPNHMTVADGYASDGTGKKIHVNLGWGGAYDDYYYLDQTNVIGGYSFNPDHTIYYNIRPCETGECNPYPPTGGSQAPVIASSPADTIIEGPTTLRLEVYDPDGDNVTLSALSSCDGLQLAVNANLLTLTPAAFNGFCQVGVEARSQNSTTFKTFMVLSLENTIYVGTEYDIGGVFTDRFDIDEFRTYLGGNISVSGNRGYSNQAFYIWIKDEHGNTVLGPSDSAVSGSLTPGFYTIAASLTSGGSYYNYDPDYSGYVLQITAEDLTFTVADLAESLNINTSLLYQCGKKGDVNHSSTIDLEDAILALQTIIGLPISVTPCVEASVDGSRIGLPEVIYSLQKTAGQM